MKNTMKEELISQMSQDQAFKVIRIFAGYSVATEYDLYATMYDVESAIDYVEFLERQHDEDIRCQDFTISVRISEAMTAIRLNQLNESTTYGGEEYHIINCPLSCFIYEPEWGEKVTTREIAKTDDYIFYEVVCALSDKRFFFNIAQKRDPFDAEIEKAPGKRFEELSPEFQNWFLNDGDYGTDELSNKSFLYLLGIKVEAEKVAPCKYNVGRDSIIAVDEDYLKGI